MKMDSNKLDADGICRTCMCEATNMRSVFLKLKDERTIKDILAFITNISINSDDSLPKQVCSECEAFLRQADAFKRRCLDVESKLTMLFTSTAPKLLSSIKPEKSMEQTNLNTLQPYQCSICLNKYPEVSVLENHVCNRLRLNEVPFLNDITLFSDSKADFVTLETMPAKEEKETVKEEFIDAFEHFDNSYSEHDASSAKEFIPPDKLMNNTLNIPTGNTYSETEKSLSENKKYKKRHICSKCDFEFDSAISLNIHKKQHVKKEVEKKYQCSLCMRKFMKNSSLTKHLRTHENRDDVKYTCGSCKREFKHKAHLDNHMVTMHANEKGLECDFCLKNFATKESLEIHKDLHKIDKKHTCQYCNKSFYMLSTLTDHIRTHTGEKPYLCSTCGRGFSQKANLAQHMRRHLGLKPYDCQQCEQRFVSKGELVAHARKHSGAHPFVCAACARGFTTSSSLAKHRRTHSGERPYACDLCHMRFAVSGTLKNHRRTHTGEKPFQCSYCEKAFVQKNDLVSHIHCHTGERPFVCSVCGSAFRKAAALRAHARAHAALATAKGVAMPF